MSPAESDRRYAHAVEAAWSRLVGRPRFLSPREFEAIEGWRRRGVPLSVVLEVIAATGKRRGGKAPRSLTALQDAIESAYEVVAHGRAGGTVASTLPGRVDALQAWDDVLRASAQDAPLRALLATLLAEAAAGRDPDALDRALDAELTQAVPADMLLRTRQDTERELSGFRSRMSDAEFQSMLARALVDRLRATLRLPRLALARL